MALNRINLVKKDLNSEELFSLPKPCFGMRIFLSSCGLMLYNAFLSHSLFVQYENNRIIFSYWHRITQDVHGTCGISIGTPLPPPPPPHFPLQIYCVVTLVSDYALVKSLRFSRCTHLSHTLGQSCFIHQVFATSESFQVFYWLHFFVASLA